MIALSNKEPRILRREGLRQESLRREAYGQKH